MTLVYQCSHYDRNVRNILILKRERERDREREREREREMIIILKYSTSLFNKKI